MELNSTTETINEGEEKKKGGPGRKKEDPLRVIKIPTDWPPMKDYTDLLDKLNKKELGSKITGLHLLEWALKNLEESDHEKIKQDSLSYNDRTHLSWVEYNQDLEVKVSKDEYLYLLTLTKKNKKSSLS